MKTKKGTLTLTMEYVTLINTLYKNKKITSNQKQKFFRIMNDMMSFYEGIFKK